MLGLNGPEMERLKTVVHEITDREGCVVYDLELTGSELGRVLRVYIDKLGSSVSIDDCTNVSHALNLRLDVEDLIPGGGYTLEVSSPGLERPLREPWHFQSALGKRVWVKSKNSMVPGPIVRKQVVGTLATADQEAITVQYDASELRIPYTNIEKAKLVFEYGQGEHKSSPGSKPKKNKKR